MAFQLNLDYFRSNRGMITTAETLFGLIGGIITAAIPSEFLAFCFWTTLIFSGALLLLNALNMYQFLQSKFSLLPKVELGYVAVWALFYLIAAIISFVPTFWSAGVVFGYLELALFLLDGFLIIRMHRSGGTTGPPVEPLPEDTGY